MASSPETANTASDQHKAEIAVLLALLLGQTRQRYSLPTLIRNAKVRPKPFRQIRTTQALASNMAAPHFAIVRAWASALPDILAAVPLGRAAVADAIERAAAGIPVAQAKGIVTRAVDLVEQYHRKQWVAKVKSSTGLDVGMFTTSADVSEPVAATKQWQNALVDDIHHDTKAKLTAVALTGGAIADVKAKANDVIAKARKRAANIGVDQTVKVSRGMDKARADAAGLDDWTWRHLDPQPHPRPEHQRRDGNIYSTANPPPTDVGEEPFCHCWREYRLR